MSYDYFASFKVGVDSEQSKGTVTKDSVYRLEETAQTIPNTTYKATSTTDGNEATTEEALAIILELRNREQTNKGMLRKLRELNESVAKWTVTVRTNLKTIGRENQKLRKENEDVESQVKDAINELQNLQEQDVDADTDRVGLTNKMFNRKGKLKKDNALGLAMQDMLKYLENSAKVEQQYVEQKETECNQMQKQLDHQIKDYEDKIDRQKELKNEAEQLEKLLKELENDVGDWWKEFNNLTNHKPEKLTSDVIESFHKAVARTIELADACKADNELLIELRDRSKGFHNRMSEIAESNKQNEMLMKQIDRMPTALYDIVSNSIENREHVGLPPHPTGMYNSSEYMKILYEWGDNERNEFAGKLKQLMATIDDEDGKCTKNEEQRKKEISYVDDDLDKLEKEESSLQSENDKLQADIDYRNAQEFVHAKKKVKSLEKILQETAIFVENRQKVLGVNQKQIEETIECEETEARENEISSETLKRKRVRLEDDIERMEKEIEYTQNRMQSRKELNAEEIQTLSAELTLFKRKLNELEQEIKAAHELIKDNERFEAEFEEINQRCNDKEKEMEAMERELRKKLEENDRLTNELDSLNDEYKKMQATLRELKRANKLKEIRISREQKTLREIKCELELEESKSMASKSVASEEPQRESQRMKVEQEQIAAKKQQQQRHNEAEQRGPVEEKRGIFDQPLKGMKSKQHQRRRSKSAKSQVYVDVYETQGNEIQVELPDRSTCRTDTGAESATQSMPTCATEPSERKMQVAFEPRTKPPRRKQRHLISKQVEYMQGAMIKSAEVQNAPDQTPNELKDPVPVKDNANPEEELPETKEARSTLNKLRKFQKSSKEMAVERTGEKSPCQNLI